VAWGRTAAEWEQLEGGLFGASLLPYLAFLYFLARTDLPPLAQKGFRFLLVFVFASIPAAIAAKVLYGEVLANVDPIHGAAESLLTVTNLILVLGMRRGVREAAGGGAGDSAGWADWAAAGGLAVASAALLVPGVGAQGSALLGSALGWHVEPANALSVPTWAIHASSLVEWVIAMGLIWQYAEVTGQPRWKGLTIAMIPCHSSGLCAVTWHLLYNAPALAPVVAAQAALTTAGNTTCAFAAWRVASAQQAAPGKASEVEEGPEGEGGGRGGQGAQGPRPRLGSDGVYVLKLTAVSVALAAAVKWGSLAGGGLLADHPSNALAFSIVGGATAANCYKWYTKATASPLPSR